MVTSYLFKVWKRIWVRPVKDEGILCRLHPTARLLTLLLEHRLWEKTCGFWASVGLNGPVVVSEISFVSGVKNGYWRCNIRCKDCWVDSNFLSISSGYVTAGCELQPLGLPWCRILSLIEGVWVDVWDVQVAAGLEVIADCKWDPSGLPSCCRFSLVRGICTNLGEV